MSVGLELDSIAASEPDCPSTLHRVHCLWERLPSRRQQSPTARRKTVGRAAPPGPCGAVKDLAFCKTDLGRLAREPDAQLIGRCDILHAENYYARDYIQYTMSRPTDRKLRGKPGSRCLDKILTTTDRGNRPEDGGARDPGLGKNR